MKPQPFTHRLTLEIHLQRDAQAEYRKEQAEREAVQETEDAVIAQAHHHKIGFDPEKSLFIFFAFNKFINGVLF